ncbi:MAG TPA: IS200/IS605 family transposase [Lacipirellulaceae bacterium]|nr:IS200/IS605 family transposase [Lacipirellulaceae bacterium]
MPNTYANLLYHLIFSTKHREPTIHGDWREELFRYIGGIIRAEGGVCVEINGMPDHVHILAKIKPALAVSDMLRLIKANSSKWVNDDKDVGRSFAWQSGYAAFSVSESRVEAVRRYIRNQAAHHRKQSFQDELVEILRRHGVECDPRYLWE